MELFLLKLVGLFRPLASLSYAATFFEIAGIALFGLLVVALLANSAMRKSLRFSSVDAAIVTFTLWCIAIYVIYFEAARISDVAKLVIPLLSFIVVKHVLHERSGYESLLRWMLIGFSVPIVASAVLIATGNGLDSIYYWTKLPRWRGAYEGSHSLGLSMTLFLMILVLYIELPRFLGEVELSRRSLLEKVVLGLLAVAAVYCLYMSQVRTAILGLLIFSAIYLYFVYRKLFLIAVLGLGVLATLTLPLWLPALLPEFSLREMGVEVKTMDLGSGRPNLWLSDLTVYVNLPIDNQLAGVGLGSRGGSTASDVEYVLHGHNDWIELLTQTGIVGLLIFVWLQFAILRKILNLVGPEKYLFIAMFAAVNIMMLVSNSFAWRIQVSQLYYMVLAYIEIQRAGAILPEGVAQESVVKQSLHRPHRGMFK